MSRVSGRSTRLALSCLAAFVGFVVIAGPPPAQADDTVWICKPGQADDLCAGTIAGKSWKAGQAQPTDALTYTRSENPPIDCFYLYPTQSEQSTPNSDLAKDPPIKRVVVQQARMFSSICKVYAPMYRQVTYSGDQSHDSADVEVAYASAKDAFEDYLQNYNHGRGFIMLGHSQGSAHTARLIDELVDTDANLRKRFVGAIAPGANIYVPKNENVGGMYQNVPACSKVGQFGCLIAYSTYRGQPDENSMFSRLDAGYWIYPESRPDPAKYEAVCTDPARLDGGNGNLLPLVNMDYLTGVPPQETATPWVSLPDYYKVSCERSGTAHWLNIDRVDGTDTRPDLGSLVASGNNYHVPEVNLAEGNLLTIAQNQSDGYVAEQNRILKLQTKLKTLNRNLSKAKRRQVAGQRTVQRLTKKLRKSRFGIQRRTLRRKIAVNRRKVKADSRRVQTIRRQITQVKQQIG
ncbi:MAG: DUF3089 domain-containing protein [Solirubrobacterales bacterium]|nr:DUF3089 domain-containing protein [Solirubrobacterales bacterium]